MKPERSKTIALGAFLVAMAVGILLAISFLTHLGTGQHQPKGQAKKLVTTLRTAVINNDFGETAQTAFKQLQELGPVAVPVAARLLNDKNPQVRLGGADLVQELIEEIRERRRKEATDDSPTPEEVLEVIPDLLQALKDEDDRVRRKAASALGWIGADANSAIPALRVTCEDENEKVRETAKRAVARIQTGVLEQP